MSAAAPLQRQKTGNPARKYRKSRPKSTSRYRARCFYSTKQRPMTRHEVIKLIRSRKEETGQKKRNFFIFYDWWKLDVGRLSRGKIHYGVTTSILRHTFGAFGKPRFTDPMLDSDFALENGFSYEGVRDAIEDLIVRGVIERKGTEGAELHCYRCLVDEWPDLPDAPKGDRSKNAISQSAMSDAEPSESGEDDEEEELTGKEAGETKGNAHSVPTPQTDSVASPQIQASRSVVRTLLPNSEATITEICAGTSSMPVTCRNRTNSPVLVTPKPLRNGLCFELTLPPLTVDELRNGLAERGYPLDAAMVKQVDKHRGDAPIGYFLNKLDERNTLQNGDPKPRAKRLPKGALPDYAAQVSQMWQVEQNVPVPETPTESPAVRRHRERMERSKPWPKT